MFWEAFEKAAQKSVAKVGIFQNGKYLMGVRQDNGKWTEPGGHLEKGESPEDGALREVKEETGITLNKGDLEYLGSKELADKDLMVHAFKSDLDRNPKIDTRDDPDDEVFGWNWVPMKGKSLPSIVQNNLHVPEKNNVLHFFLGFEKSARMRISKHMKAFIADTPAQALQEYNERYYEKKRKKRNQTS